MVCAVLTGAGLDHGRFSVVPFPINFPDLYRHYVTLDVLFFLSIYDDWGREKFRYFKSLGLKAHVLWEVPPERKGISAAEVRALMLSGGPWERLVPPEVPALMERWDVLRRLKSLG